MYAVIGIWSVDDAHRQERDRALHEEVVPLTEAQPGFVAGYWMQDPVTGKGHTVIILDGLEHANGFKTLVESRAQKAAQAGVTGDILSVVEVIATSGGTP